MSAKVVLQVISGPIQGKVFEFDTHDTFVFGRGKECHAKIPKDGYVSRHHFLLEVNPPQATIRDLGSLNGTHVNGVRYGGRKADSGTGCPRSTEPQAVLKDRDLIMVGKTRIRVRVAASSCAEDRTLAPASGAAVSPRMAGLYVPTVVEAVGDDAVPAGSKEITCLPPDHDHEYMVPDMVPAPGEGMPPKSSEGVAPNLAKGVASPGRVNSPHPNPLRGTRAAGRGEGTDRPAEAEEAGGLRALIRRAAKDFPSRPQIEIEGYEMQEPLGQGGMGAVYKAVRKLDQFPVAVKVMLAKVAIHETARQRFQREIDIIRKLSHANIVALIASGSVRNAFYFVSEYCSGGSLAELACRQGGRVPLPVLAPIILQSLKGLAHAHKHGFVHRDIKPANILLHQQQRGWAAKMGDFGLAKQFEQAGFSGMTLTGAVGGTYDFMPREQLTDFKNTLPVSDVWSLGATFYVVLTGVPPRPCPEGRDAMEVVLRDEHVPVRQRAPRLPPALARMIDKSLAIDVADRYQDAGEMHQALKEVLSK